MMTLVHEVFDERVVGGKVEDVILHDPCGHDEHRLRWTCAVAGGY